MGVINKPLCATSFGNTGFGECFLDPGKIVGAIMVPKNFEITEDDALSLQAFLQAKTSAGIGLRIYPFPKFETITDNTEDITVNTLDYGTRIVTREGSYDWTFRYLQGAVQLHQQLKKLQGPGKYFIYYDDQGTLFGTRSGGVLKGIPTTQFIVPPWRPATGAEVAIYTVRMITDPQYLNGGNFAFIKVTDFNLYDIQGLQAVDVTVEDLTGNVATVSLKTKVSGVSMGAYGAALAASGAWKAVNKKTGASLAITGVVYNSGNDTWAVTFNLSAYNAIPEGDKIGLGLVGAEVLSESPYNVDGYETEEVVITKPGS